MAVCVSHPLSSQSWFPYPIIDVIGSSIGFEVLGCLDACLSTNGWGRGREGGFVGVIYMGRVLLDETGSVGR